MAACCLNWEYRTKDSVCGRVNLVIGNGSSVQGIGLGMEKLVVKFEPVVSRLEFPYFTILRGHGVLCAPVISLRNTNVEPAGRVEVNGLKCVVSHVFSSSQGIDLFSCQLYQEIL